LLRKRPWDSQFFLTLASLKKGDAIRFELIQGEVASGKLLFVQRTNGTVLGVAGELIEPQAGRFFFQKQTIPGVAGDFVGVVTLPESGRAYRIEPSGPRGSSELVERPLEQVICQELPRASGVPPEEPVSFQAQKPNGTLPQTIPDYQNGIVALESFPGAKAVIYLDFQGGFDVTSGITYERPDVNNDQISYVWQTVTEDFRPFSIDVTTDLAVYQNAPANSRQRVIITPTTTAAPEAGGVAEVGSFNWTSEIACWVFMTKGKDCAEACSHEIGHTLGLIHEGQEYDGVLSEYYTGHGTGETSWAPIMGLAYAANVTQWSRGEYLYGDNPQDQLAIITTQNNNVGYRPDDTGDTLATSRYLEIYTDYTASADGVIERTEDTDAFQFTTSGGPMMLGAYPISCSPNLAVRVSLCDANDRLLASNQPEDTLCAAVSTNLPAGTYTFCVSGAGRKNPLTNGFSSYASLGYYAITGSVANALLPNRFTVQRYATNGTLVGTLYFNSSNPRTLDFQIRSGNSNNTFAIDSSGTLFVVDNTLLDRDEWITKPEGPVRFELLIDIVDLLDPAKSQTKNRVVITLLSNPTPPFIRIQPQDVSAIAGSNVTFTVVAKGDMPLNYQWFFNGSVLSAATNAVLQIPDVQARDAGIYTVTISNQLGSIRSQDTYLAVDPSAPVITDQPLSQVAALGYPVTFTLTAGGTAPITYQWRFNGSDCRGATAAQFRIASASIANAGSYQVLASNVLGTTLSQPASLALTGAPPTILINPTSQASFLGGQATLEVVSQGSPDLEYQWCFNGGYMPGATDPMLVLRKLRLDQAGSYSVLVSNAFGTATSEDAQICVAQVIAWGAGTNFAGPINRGQSLVPANLREVVGVAGGYTHSLVVDANGKVTAWGAGTNASNWTGGDLGQSAVPINLSNVMAIAAGGYHSLALRGDGNVVDFGGSGGQSIVPASLQDIVDVAAGQYHSVALKRDGHVVVWASASFTETNLPANALNLVGISARGNQTLGVRGDSTVVRWGSSNHVPAGLSNVVAVAAGVNHCLALKENGTVVSWDSSFTPPAGLTNVVQIAAGSGFSLALINDGTLVGWGESSPASDINPLRLGVSNVTAIACGSYHCLAALGDGSVSINTQPRSILEAAGTRTFLRVGATGARALSYQWQRNCQDLPQATNSVLIFDALEDADAGEYRVIVSDSLTSVTSQSAEVSLVWNSTNSEAPQIIVQPSDLVVRRGAVIALSASVSSASPLSVQWFKDDFTVAEGNSSSLVISNATRTDSGSYRLVATNQFGSVTGRCAQVQVRVPQRLTISRSPQQGWVVILSVDADGTTLQPMDLPTLRVQFSTNLVDWSELPGDMVLTNGVVLFPVQQDVGESQGFFRIVQH
jgi:alpha-tubulin suppressor-like RCC1 family protein